MKNMKTWIVYLLLLLTLGCYFFPLVTFDDVSLPLLQAEVAKYQKRYDDQVKRYDDYVADGKDQGRLDKQKKKVDSAKAKVDEAQAAVDAKLAEATAAGSSLSMSLFDAKIPNGLEFDNKRINESGVYKPNPGQLPWLIYGSFFFFLLAIVFFALGKNKLVSLQYTLSSFSNLVGWLMLCYAIWRISALPIADPYSDPKLSGMQWALVLLPLFALLLNCSMYGNTKRSMIYVLCISLSVLSLFPFWIMIVNATRNTHQIQQGLSLIPGTALMNNFKILTGKNFDVLIGFRNSAIIAFGSTILSVYFSSITAYGLTAYQYKGRNALFSIVVGIIMIPTQVSATGFYMFMYQINWTNSFLPLIVPAIAAPTTVFFLCQYLKANLQLSLVEAARIDGAKELYTFNHIIIPIMMPTLATMGIMAVIGSWNNYLGPLMLLSKPDLATLPMMVQMLRGDIYRTEYGSIYLGLTITALPLLIVYFAFSKHIIRGIAVGGVKE